MTSKDPSKMTRSMKRHLRRAKARALKRKQKLEEKKMVNSENKAASEEKMVESESKTTSEELMMKSGNETASEEKKEKSGNKATGSWIEEGPEEKMETTGNKTAGSTLQRVRVPLPRRFIFDGLRTRKKAILPKKSSWEGETVTKALNAVQGKAEEEMAPISPPEKMTSYKEFEFNGDLSKMTRSMKRHLRRAKARALKRTKMLEEGSQKKGVKSESKTPKSKNETAKSENDRADTTAVECGAAPRSSHLDIVPYSVLVGVMLPFLSPEDVIRLGQTSKSILNVCEDGILWKSLYSRKHSMKDLTHVSMKEWKRLYLLHVNQAIDSLRCFHSKRHLFQDVLGIPLQVSINPKHQKIDYIHSSMDLLSHDSFSYPHSVRTDAFGDGFTHWMPLFLTQDHFERALPLLKKSIVKLSPHWRTGKFHPFMVLDVLPKLMTTFTVLLSDKGIAGCTKALNGFANVHRLFLALTHEYPMLKREIENRLVSFGSSEKNRHKDQIRSLGDLLPLLTVSDKVTWRMFWRVYLSEDLDRAVLWMGKHNHNIVKLPSQEELRDEKRRDILDQKLLNESYEAIRVRNRLTMFFAYFLNVFCRGTTEEQANRYDRLFGKIGLEEDLLSSNEIETDSETAGASTQNQTGVSLGGSGTCLPSVKSMQKRVSLILAVEDWCGFFKFVGAEPPSKAQIAHIIRSAVRNSLRKRYHTKHTRFDRIQSSGVSKILHRGESVQVSLGSDSTDGLRSLTFVDEWKYDGPVKYLDATCIAVDQKGNRLALVDYKSLRAPGMNHSGDQMGAGQGTHRLLITLSNLPRNTSSLFFVLSAWNGAKLGDIRDPTVQCQDGTTEEVLCRYDHTHGGADHMTAVVMCRLYRGVSNKWFVQAIGQACDGCAGRYGPIMKAIKTML